MQAPHIDDLALTRDVVSGMPEAWTRLVDQYSGLIISVVRRYLYKEDEDEQRNIYVRVLEDLYTRRLAEYDGRSSLATWIVTITRSRSLDFLRARYGRRSAPKWLEQGNSKERAVYNLYYVQGLDLGEIVRRLKADGESATRPEVVECIQALEARMSRPLRDRLAYDLQARNGGPPADLLGDALRRAAELAPDTDNPEYRLFMDEQQQVLDRLRGYVENLETEEKNAVHLHFYEGLTAREMAERMRLGSSRRAYTVLARAIRRLRESLAERGTAAHERNRSR